MKIGGFQKLTLLDYPGQMACILFTQGCNFRCPFCHNSGLVLPGEIGEQEKEEEILAYLKKRQGMLEGVVVTGGEPLLQKDLPGFLKKIKRLDYRIKLDTNGSLPDRLKILLEEKLIDYAAVDLKQTSEKYGLVTGVSGANVMPLVKESLSLLEKAGIPYELRTTIVKGLHTPDDLVKIAEQIAGDRPYYLQSYVDSGSVISPEGLSAYSTEELEEILRCVKVYCPQAALRI